MTAGMQPEIRTLQQLQLVGHKLQMSFANNRTHELWQGFMPKRSQITNTIGVELYSVEVFDNPAFFEKFDPSLAFEKWAAVAVHSAASIPAGMETLLIPAGQYAVFQYKGKPSEAQAIYQYIYGTWFPSSRFRLDNRPHFALMGEKYKGEHPDSEEELWFPVKDK